MLKIIAIIFVVALTQVVNAQVGLYGQCGGQGFNGQISCASGLLCIYQNPYYSQCLPGSNSLSTTTQSAKKVWYGDFAQFSSWNIKNSYLSENREIVNDPKGGNDKVLKVKYPAGSYSTLPGAMKGGCGFYVYPFENQNIQSAVFEYSVLFPSDFDFVKGGKLPGMFGGRTGCSGGDDALDCFTARFMFGSNGTGYAYLYVSKKANHTQEFCNLAGLSSCSPQYGYGIGFGRYFVKDKWIRIKEMIRLNTPGQPNGRLTVSIDDVVKFDFDKIIFRTNNVAISGFVFETFFGGSTSNWATPKLVFSYFKNFKFENLQ